MKFKTLLLCLSLIFTISTTVFSQEDTTPTDNYKNIENEITSVETKINQMLQNGDLVKNSTDTERIIVLLNEIQTLLNQGNTTDVGDKLDEANGIMDATDDTTATEKTLPKYYVVQKKEPPRDCLWRIAGYDFVYGDSKYWNIIYEANKNIIKDADLIYPGQIFEIPSLSGEKREGTYDEKKMMNK